MRNGLSLLILLLIFFSSCNTQNPSSQKENNSANEHQDKRINSTNDNLSVTSVYQYPADSLIVIRENYNRINTIKKWTSIKKKELEETTEGGEASFYFLNNQLEKITVNQFGETFQYLAEYYLFNAKLSFVFEKTYRYNRPIYYDSTSMKENGDNETFDIDKSNIEEKRSYFKNGNLVYQKNDPPENIRFTKPLLAEEATKINNDFSRLVKIQ